jgi:hypothetical protein
MEYQIDDWVWYHYHNGVNRHIGQIRSFYESWNGNECAAIDTCNEDGVFLTDIEGPATLDERIIHKLEE